jgi:hypothetical protein
MNAADAIRNSLDVGHMVTQAYLSDMTDEELMMRPHSGCNHVNWQLGHLIASEHQLNNSAMPDCMPPLPEGFLERYAKEAAASDDPADFADKETLFNAYEQQRSATRAILDRLSPEDLDKPSPEHLQAYAPTLGAVLNLHGLHHLMHCGQWAVLRRILGKPIVI